MQKPKGKIKKKQPQIIKKPAKVIVKSSKKKQSKSVDGINETNSSKRLDSKGRDITYVAEKMAESKAKILIELEKTFGIVTNAIAKARISNVTFYKWYKNDEDFARAVDDIQDGFDVIVEDYLKQKIIAKDGHSIRFYLSHRVAKYKPKIGIGMDKDAKPIKLMITTFDPDEETKK